MSLKWLDCEKMDIKNLHLYEDEAVNQTFMYLEKVKNFESNIWFDNLEKKCFGLDLNYSNSLDGACFTSRADFKTNLKYGKLSLQQKFYIDQEEGLSDEEYLITKSDLLTKFQNSKILVIGAGPSSLDSSWKKRIPEYDYIWSCNHYFRSDLLKEIEFDLISVGNEVNLREPLFLKRFHRDKNCIFGLETSVFRPSTPAFKEFLNLSKNRRFFYMTRFFGKIGSIPRMLILASKLGPKKIGFVGMDGVAPPEMIEQIKSSIFQDKLPQGPKDHNLSRRHFVMLWDYILNELDPERSIMFENLGKDYEFNLTGTIPE